MGESKQTLPDAVQAVIGSAVASLIEKKIPITSNSIICVLDEQAALTPCHTIRNNCRAAIRALMEKMN